MGARVRTGRQGQGVGHRAKDEQAERTRLAGSGQAQGGPKCDAEAGQGALIWLGKDMNQHGACLTGGEERRSRAGAEKARLVASTLTSCCGSLPALGLGKRGGRGRGRINLTYST